jgi:hypothetical protein
MIIGLILSIIYALYLPLMGLFTGEIYNNFKNQGKP